MRLRKKEIKMKTERELFLRYWTDNNLPYDGDDDDMEVAWTAWQASTSREGYKLVPVEPPEDMDIKICRLVDHRIDVFEADRIYKAMIGAADE